MSRSTKRKAPPLPSWASLSKPLHQDDEDDSTLSEEDAYLRTCAYRSAHSALEQALTQSLNDSLGDSFSTVLSDVLDDDEEQKEEEEKRTVVVDPTIAKFVVRCPPRKRSRCCRETGTLPIITLEGPFALTDRILWIEHLMDATKQNRANCRVMQWGVDNLEKDSSWLASPQKHGGDDDADKRKNTIVFIRNDSSSFLYSNQLQDVLQTLSGKVAAVVLMLPANFRRSIHWRCSVDVDVHHEVLPTSETILDHFWERTKHFCLPFGDLEPLCLRFYDQNLSVVSVLRELQRRCLYRLSASGSFWSALPLLFPPEVRRVNSLLFDSRNTLRSSIKDWLVESEVRRYSAKAALVIRRRLWEWRADSPKPDRVAFLFALVSRSATLDEEHDAKLCTDKKRELLSILFSMLHGSREQSTTFDQMGLDGHDVAPFVSQIHDRIADVIRTLAILIDQCSYISQVNQCVIPIIREFQMGASPSPVTEQGLTMHQPKMHQPRQEFIHALLSLDSDEEEKARDLAIPSCLYGIMLDQYSITETEWFHSFLELYEAKEEKSPIELFRLFACGARHLQTCGLVRSRKSSKNTVFEKSAVVWCSEDHS